MFVVLFKIGNDILQFIQFQLLKYLFFFVDFWNFFGVECQFVIKGVLIVLGMFVIVVFQIIMIYQYFQFVFVIGMRIKGGLILVIYKKLLRFLNEGCKSKIIGDIVNYMVVDVQWLQDFMQFVQQLWFVFFQIIICLVLLYQFVGWFMFVGVGVMIVMILINGMIVKFMKNL